MTYTLVFPPGGMLANTRSFFPASVARIDDMSASGGREAEARATDIDPPDPYSDEPRWPAWKVTVFVIAFCGAFWAGISYLAMRLMG